MAFANYTELQESVAGWLTRSDLTARIPDFIRLAELRFNRVLRLAGMAELERREYLPLTDAEPTNYILEHAPDIYLYGALLEAAPYLKNDARIPVWKGAFDNAIAEFQTKEIELDYPDGLIVKSDIQ